MGSEVVVKTALPPESGRVATTVDPCMKLTVPTTTGAVRVLTVAVKVTGCPGKLGLPELETPVVVSD